MSKFALLFLASSILIGCAETKTSSAVGINEYKIAYGETILIKKNEISFISIIEDSRCPTNVQCIWKGRAIIQFDVNGILKEIYFGETRPNESKSLKVFSDYEVDYLSPIPEAGKEIEINSYVVTLKKRED